MQKGFFASLFDISFSSLITTKIIKILYVLILIGIGLATLIFVISAFAADSTTGLIVLIFAPIGALLYTIWARVGLEVIIVLFKIGENTGELVRQGASGQPGGGQPALASPGGGMAPPPGVQPEGPGGDFAAPVGRAHPHPPQTEQHAPTQQRPPGVAGTPAGWYPDPQAEKRLRYWDGSGWTEHTSD